MIAFAVVVAVLAAAAVPIPAAHAPAAPATPAPTLTLPRKAAAALRALGGRIAGREVRAVLDADAIFAPGTATLRADADPLLERFATVARALPGAAATVTVHCDALASEATAIDLTVRQGQAIAGWLSVRGGLGARWVTTRGLGATEPRAREVRADGSPDPEGRRRNRRIELVLRQR